MKRVTEPELMNEYEQVKAYSEADFSQSDQSLISNIRICLDDLGINLKKESLILDIGCGPGNISELLAESWPSSVVLGIDGAEEMLLVANDRLEKKKNKGKCCNLSYVQKNFHELIKEKSNLVSSADFLVSNSVLHHLENPNDFWILLKKLGKNGSLTFNRDLRRPASREKAEMIREKYQSSSPEPLARDFLASLHAAFTVAEIKKQLNDVHLEDFDVYEYDDRYLEVVGILQ